MLFYTTKNIFAADEGDKNSASKIDIGSDRMAGIVICLIVF